MLSSSLSWCMLGSLHFLCEISLTLASNSWWDESPMGCAPKKWSHFRLIPVINCLYSKYKLAWQKNGMGEEKGGIMHVLAWEGKNYLAEIISFQWAGAWSFTQDRVVVQIKVKSGIQNLVPIRALCVILLFQGAGCLQLPELPVGLWAAQHFSDWFY